MPASSHNLDSIRVIFDDDNAVADAGLLLLTATLVDKLGVEALVDETVTVGYRPGRKLLTLVQTLVAGGDCIDDTDVLRAGATGRVVSHRVMAPSTIGTWLRQFTFGHLRQLDRVTEVALTRAWKAGGSSGEQPMFIDMDSTICAVHGLRRRVRRTATPTRWVTTRWLPPVLTLARCCTPGCAKDRRTPPAERSGSCVRPSVGFAARVRAAS